MLTIVNLELSRLLKFGHIALAFQGTSSGQENVFVIPVNVLRPVGKPSYGIVMSDGLPLPRYIRNGDRSRFSDINSDILWPHTKLRKFGQNEK